MRSARNSPPTGPSSRNWGADAVRRPHGLIASRAEEILHRREVLGWKLGLERMRRLCLLLGLPQNRFASIHVVGTNGKTSVTRMTAALIEAHGVTTGAYVSPHISSWRERVLIRGEPISEELLAGALGRAEEAAAAADRAAGDEGPVTQFELLTAAAFLAFAAARVQYAVIEAGLGGRLDATNVIPSKLTVLTSVGYDHTEWLGETLEEIAAEKVAVLRDHTALVAPQMLPPEVEAVVKGFVEERHALDARADNFHVRRDGLEVVHGYQRRNLALAALAARMVLGEDFDDGTVTRWTAQPHAIEIKGRAQAVSGDPPTIFDAAHNADGARALAEALPELADDLDVVCCLAILEGKDAPGIVNALAHAVSRFVCTEIPPERIEGSGRPGGRSRAALEIAALCEKAGVEAEAIPDPIVAWERARELAGERKGVALAAGSHYLLSSIWTERPAQSS
ncbi:MAG TPA: Mur ligase family protein [Solirubrobacterales bacterium]|nr:Mur ligase family protein [Solirubrobacterales bacterium]